MDFPPEITLVAEPRRSSNLGQFPVDHLYVETLWLPVIGPSATLMLRRCGAWLLAWPNGCLVSVPQLSEALGLGGASGTSSSIQKTLRRLVQFGLATWDAPTSTLTVATRVPPLTAGHLRRLSVGLVRAHDSFCAPWPASRDPVPTSAAH